MKYLIGLFLFVHNFVVSQTVLPDEKKNCMVLTIASSASIISKFNIPNTKSNIFRSQSIPPLNLCLDFASNTNFTFGIAYFYEKFEFYKFVNSGSFQLKNGVLSTKGHFSEAYKTYARHNAGLRLLVHSNINNNDFYLGVRFGYDFYNGNLVKFSTFNLDDKFSTQFILGYRRFVNNVGFNSEIAIGKPYWLFAGVNYKFQSMSK